jgi:hypothetical protein
MADKRNAYKILVEKPEGKTPLGRYRRRWLHVIKMEKKKKKQDKRVWDLSGSG